MEPTDCTRCWYACRGESEASLTMERVAELLQRTYDALIRAAAATVAGLRRRVPVCG